MKISGATPPSGSRAVAVDVIRDGGHLTLGSRLKRLGDRLQADVQRLSRAEGIEVPAAAMPILVVLDEQGPLAVGEVARAVRIAQPGATRLLGRLTDLGLVEGAGDGPDQRVRCFSLTDRGVETVAALRSGLWPRVERAVAALCAGLDGPLLSQVADLEDALDELPLDRRAAQVEDE